jgi:hypothetical protein
MYRRIILIWIMKIQNVSVWSLFVSFRILSRHVGCCEHGNQLSDLIRDGEYFDQLSKY